MTFKQMILDNKFTLHTIVNRIFVAFILLISGNLSAQLIQRSDTLYCNYIGQEKGLLQLNVKNLTIDDLGYLWAGTEDGLHKFNGYEFKPYVSSPIDTTSIKDDHIRGLLSTKDTLWIATDSKGIIGFVPSKNKFFDLISKSDLDLKTSYKIFKLNKTFILFSVKNNFILFNRKTKQATIIRLPNTAKENYVSAVLKLNNGKYWLGTTTLGILEFDISNMRLQTTRILENVDIRYFLKKKKNAYIATEEGLFTYDLISNKISKTTFKYSVNCFNNINDNQFYIGTGSGLFLYDVLTSTIIPFVIKTKENRISKKIDINSIINDDKGNLWIGTEGEGLVHFNSFKKKFNTIKLSLKEFPLVANISSFQFLKGKDSTLWIGTKYGVVKYFHKTMNFKFYDSKNHPLIYAIVRDKNNTIWAGGFTTGLLKYDSEKDIFNKITTSTVGLSDNDVVEIIPIDSNKLWVATWAGGIFEFDIKNEKFKELFINGKRINRARTSLIDSEENRWLGTDQGAYKISKNGRITRYHIHGAINQKLSSNRVFSIKEDSLNNIWIGTNVGLTKLEATTNKITLYYKQKGLPNDFIYSILIAEDSHIWVSTNFGISVLNPITNTFKNYTTSDGLQNNEFNGKAGYKDEFGNFYFGGISGLNIFKPKEIIENPFLPSVYIESVDLFNKPIQKNELYKNELQFKSNENVITFNFSALNYLNPEKCTYTYKMEGFDTDWRPVTNNRSTTYTNLNHGNYVFKVKASNDVGVWNNKPTSIGVVIIPPWYQTTIFRVLFSVVFLLSGFFFYYYKTRRLKKDKLKLEAIINERTQEIVDKNSALKTASKKVEGQRDNIRFLMKERTHRVKNNLQIISSLLNIQANTLENKQAISALKMAKNRILAIAHIENKIVIEDNSIQIDTFIKELSESIIYTLADEEKLKFKITYNLAIKQMKNLNTTLIGLILNELITNTSKYAFDKFNAENELIISCKISDNSMRLIISDNGKGYSIKNDISTKSLGIELVTEMVRQLNATISINAINGVENIIDIPINK